MLTRVRSVMAEGRRPPRWAGAAASLGVVAVCTLALYPLKDVAPVTSLGVIYLLGVGVVAAIWGLWLGIVTSLLSALAFNFFHLPPVGRLTIASSRDLVALMAYLVVALATSLVSELARRRAADAQRGRVEADLTADMAHLLLAQGGVSDALALIGQRLAVTLDLPWAEIALAEVKGDDRRRAIALGPPPRRVGTLLIPATLPESLVSRVRERVVPALSAVLAIALERERLVGERVETEGLRRSEAVKTAVLRAVSHDLRSPVTAMLTAGAAVRSPGLSDAERAELGELVVEQGTRLARLIDDLLDLSKIEAHATAPRITECSLEEVIDAALADQPREADFRVRVDAELPPVKADFVQIERVLANLLENATRHSGGQPVTIRARGAGDRAIVQVIDTGPGIPESERERIFEPFYRLPGQVANGHVGSGLGLAIAKGFVETNDGRIRVESSPGQGTAFVVELPLAGR